VISDDVMDQVLLEYGTVGSMDCSKGVVEIKLSFIGTVFYRIILYDHLPVPRRCTASSYFMQYYELRVPFFAGSRLFCLASF
jgi:hypothetical protein